jgi:hypothetical protein
MVLEIVFPIYCRNHDRNDYKLSRSKSMALPKSKRKHYVVDDRPYTACVNENGTTADWGVKLSVAIKAEYGMCSLCLIKGIVNREYWKDYPNFDPTKTFAITPRVICRLIQNALKNGWDPMVSKSQCNMQMDNEALLAIIAERNPSSGRKSENAG